VCGAANPLKVTVVDDRDGRKYAVLVPEDKIRTCVGSSRLCSLLFAMLLPVLCDTVRVDVSSMTVAKVKRTLSRATGVPPQQIRLCLNGLVLEDRLTPADMDLYDGAVLQMYAVDDYEPGLGQDLGEIRAAAPEYHHNDVPAPMQSAPVPRTGRRNHPYHADGATEPHASHTVNPPVPEYVGPAVPPAGRAAEKTVPSPRARDPTPTAHRSVSPVFRQAATGAEPADPSSFQPVASVASAATGTPAPFDVSVRLNRRLMLRRIFMQLQSRPGDKTESVAKRRFHDALASNDAVLPFLRSTTLLDQLKDESGGVFVTWEQFSDMLTEAQSAPPIVPLTPGSDSSGGVGVSLPPSGFARSGGVGEGAPPMPESVSNRLMAAPLQPRSMTASGSMPGQRMDSVASLQRVTTSKITVP
jgi:hypothetical protein